jgi:hypothetical protein
MLIPAYEIQRIISQGNCDNSTKIGRKFMIIERIFFRA